MSLGLKNQAEPQLLSQGDFSLETHPITLDSARPLSDFNMIMEELLRDKPEHFILYVHGRGAHPGKAIRSGILADMENTYNAKVLMFRWPSWIRFDVRPHYNAQQSGRFLHSLLKSYAQFKIQYRSQNPNYVFNDTLLAHSMGNIVLQHAISAQMQTSPLPDGLFKRVLLVAADVDTKDHHLWLEKLNFADKIEVISNRTDSILQTVSSFLDRPRLGVRAVLQHEQPLLAKNARYIDLTGLAIQHEYHFGVLRPLVVKQLFTDLVQNNPDNLIPHGLMNGKLLYRLD